MALTTPQSTARPVHSVEPALASWVAPLFAAGLAAIYVGERVWVGSPGGALAVSALGALLCSAATAVRFLPTASAPGRNQVARLLGAIQALGLLSLGLYLLLSERFFGGAASAHPIWLDAGQVAWVGALAVAVLALAFGEVALHPMRRSSHLEVRRVQAATGSGVVLGLAATYGALFVYAAAKQEAQADYSYFKTSKPGESTLKIVDQISEPILVTGFFPQVSEVRKEVQSYLSRLSQRNPKLEVKLVDRYLEPKLAKELKVVSDGTLVLSRGETQQTLSLGTDILKARPKLMSLDKDFNARLVKLLRSRRLAYLTTGHGELNDADRGDAGVAEGRTASVFKQIIEQQNYRTKELGLNQGLGNAVPDDADVVFVLGPLQPFASEEIAALGRYAKAGGKIFMALDNDGVNTAAAGGLAVNPPKPDAAKDVPTNYTWLVELAAAVGAEYVPVELADEERSLVRRNDLSDRGIFPTNRFSSHASVSTLSRNSARAGVVVAGAGHFNKSDTGKFQAEVTVRTFPSAFADTDGDFKQGASEPKTVYNLGVALTSAKTPGGTEPSDTKPKDAKAEDVLKANPEAAKEMRAFVFADADAFSDLLMGRVPGNQMLAFDAIRWLAGEESFAGEIESEEDVRIDPTKQKDVAWFYATIFGVPVCVLLAGVLVSRRAQRKGGKPA